MRAKGKARQRCYTFLAGFRLRKITLKTGSRLLEHGNDIQDFLARKRKIAIRQSFFSDAPGKG